MDPFKLALLNLLRRKIPTIIALLSIAIAVACGSSLLKLYYLSGSRFNTMGAGGDAVVGAKAGGIEILLGSLNGEGEYPEFLPYKLYESLAAPQPLRFEDGSETQTSFVESVIPMVIAAKFKNYRLIGTNQYFFERPVAKDSLLLSDGIWFENNNEVVVGALIAKREGLQIGSSIKIHPWVGGRTSFHEIPMQVVGILQPTNSAWDQMLYTSISQAQTLLQTTNIGEKSIWGTNVLNYFLVYIKPGGMSSLESLINRRSVGQIISISKEKQKLADLTSSGRQLGFLMTLFIMFLGGLSVTGILVTRFEAMSTQFAVLRAIGYSKIEIAKWLIWEGLLLGISASIIGACIDWLFFPILRSLLASALPPAELVSTPFYSGAPIWISAIAATVLAIVIPLIRIYRQNVHLLLKGL